MSDVVAVFVHEIVRRTELHENRTDQSATKQGSRCHQRRARGGGRGGVGNVQLASTNCLGRHFARREIGAGHRDAGQHLGGQSERRDRL